jgi:hypothetical protein
MSSEEIKTTIKTRTATRAKLPLSLAILTRNCKVSLNPEPDLICSSLTILVSN